METFALFHYVKTKDDEKAVKEEHQSDKKSGKAISCSDFPVLSYGMTESDVIAKFPFADKNLFPNVPIASKVLVQEAKSKFPTGFIPILSFWLSYTKLIVLYENGFIFTSDWSDQFPHTFTFSSTLEHMLTSKITSVSVYGLFLFVGTERGDVLVYRTDKREDNQQNSVRSVCSLNSEISAIVVSDDTARCGVVMKRRIVVFRVVQESMYSVPILNRLYDWNVPFSSSAVITSAAFCTVDGNNQLVHSTECFNTDLNLNIQTVYTHSQNIDGSYDTKEVISFPLPSTSNCVCIPQSFKHVFVSCISNAVVIVGTKPKVKNSQFPQIEHFPDYYKTKEYSAIPSPKGSHCSIAYNESECCFLLAKGNGMIRIFDTALYEIEFAVKGTQGRWRTTEIWAISGKSKKRKDAITTIAWRPNEQFNKKEEKAFQFIATFGKETAPFTIELQTHTLSVTSLCANSLLNNSLERALSLMRSISNESSNFWVCAEMVIECLRLKGEREELMKMCLGWADSCSELSQILSPASQFFQTVINYALSDLEFEFAFKIALKSGRVDFLETIRTVSLDCNEMEIATAITSIIDANVSEETTDQTLSAAFDVKELENRLKSGEHLSELEASVLGLNYEGNGLDNLAKAVYAAHHLDHEYARMTLVAHHLHKKKGKDWK